MQTEIERKFLTTSSLFKEQAVRVIVKSNERLSRLEYEIPIPKKDAEELLKRTCGRIIHKTRYIIPATSGMLKWEVDEFHGEFYPCKPDIFEKTYERVTDEAD